MSGTDLELVHRSQAGDRDAFDQLITRYRDRIVNLAYHMLGSVHEAEDAAQEVFVRAYLALRSFREESGFFTWLYRIAVNWVYSQAKRRNRRGRLLQAAGQEPRSWSAAAARSPEEQAAGMELQTLLWSAIQELEPRYRQVLVLRELEDLDVDEVAALLQLPRGTVKSRLFRAKEALRRTLRPWYREPGAPGKESR